MKSNRMKLFGLTIFLLLTVVLSESTKTALKRAHIKRKSQNRQETMAKSRTGIQTETEEHAHTTTKDSRDVELAQYSNDIYNGCFPGATVCQEETGHSVRYALVTVNGDDGSTPAKCYVIIRGTQNLDNWESDMDFPLIQNPFGQGNVHQGFLDIMNNILQVQAYTDGLNACATSNAYIAFTGHSLGGAVATLAALQFINTHAGYSTLHYATFGSPRVGNYYFQQDVLTRLSHMGNRYESVQSEQGSTLGSWLGFAHTSPCGDGALPGDIVPRIPPITPITIKLSALALQISSPSFWGVTGDLLSQLLDSATDNEMSRQNGYRHVGIRIQLTCDSDNLLTCHSITNTYLPALNGPDNGLRYC